MKQTYYEILNVNAGATQKEIKSAYRRLAHAHHPDKNMSTPESLQIFIDASHAYDILRCKSSREKYDKHLKAQREAHIGRGRKASTNHSWEAEHTSPLNFAREIFNIFNYSDCPLSNHKEEDVRHYNDLL